MRAAMLREVGAPFEVRDDVELGGPGPGEVRVRLRASGVCHSDLSIQDGTFPHPLPCIPGHEGAGEVVGVGEGVADVAVGDHVVISWIPLCGRCRFCLGGRPNLCVTTGSNILPRFRVGGEPVLAGMGTATFAEETVVGRECVVPIPRDVPLDLAALVGCGVTTGVGAVVNTARVEPGSSVVVVGCGGVGVNVIQGARLAGAAEIVAVDPVEAKHDAALGFGATHAVTPAGLPGLLRDVTGGDGFDYAFEVVGRPETIRTAWDATRRAGTTVVVGAGRADVQVPFSPFELFYFERRLLGCVYGSADPRRDFPMILDLWRAGRLDLEGLVSRRLDLAELPGAFAAMARGEGGIRSLVEL